MSINLHKNVRFPSQASSYKMQTWTEHCLALISWSSFLVWNHWAMFMNGSWWRHQTETFSALLAFVRAIHRSPVKSSHKGQWRGSMMLSLVCVRINGWVKNHEAGDLERHRAHYDVIVMWIDQLVGMAQAFSRKKLIYGMGAQFSIAVTQWRHMTTYSSVHIASGNYLNRCRLLISKCSWHSSERNSVNHQSLE